MNPRNHADGFSLMEVILSIGVLAVTLPVVMALTMAGGSGSREAAHETRAVLLARSVMDEVAMAREGRGRIIEEALSWPEFPDEATPRLVLKADRAARLTGSGSLDEYERGVEGREAGFLVSVKGSAPRGGSDPGGANLSRVEVRIETPARAAAGNRTGWTFTRLMHADD